MELTRTVEMPADNNQFVEVPCQDMVNCRYAARLKTNVAFSGSLSISVQGSPSDKGQEFYAVSGAASLSAEGMTDKFSIDGLRRLRFLVSVVTPPSDYVVIDYCVQNPYIK